MGIHGGARQRGGVHLGPYGDTCIGVSGTGLHVDSVRVSRGKSDRSMICDYSATVTVSGVPRVWRSGTVTSPTGRRSANRQGGAVCETIHR